MIDDKTAPISPDKLDEVKGFKLPDISRFLVFIFASILIATVLVIISMDLYLKSGAAQLDLSRPSYEDVRSQASKLKVKAFSASGPIDKDSLDSFNKTFEDTNQSITDKQDSFDPTAVSDKTLGIKVR